jgi:hypothetical protein
VSTVNQNTVWSDPAAIAAQLVADSIRKFETRQTANKRSAERQSQKSAEKKQTAAAVKAA